MTSIRRRLLFWFLLLSLIGWGVTMAATWFQVRDEIEEVYDGNLIQKAHELAEMVPVLMAPGESGPGQGQLQLKELLKSLSHPTSDNFYAATLSARIWWHGKPLHSAVSPQTLPHPGNQVMETSNGMREWRRYTYYDAKNQVLVEVTEQHNARSHIIREIAGAAIQPLLVLVPLLAIGAWLAVSRGLLPLGQVVKSLHHRKPNDLRAIEMRGAPVEIRPLLEALNHLFERVRVAMRRERQFAGDASHELRTPLAALRVQAQLASRTPDPAQRERALTRLVQGIDRATHVVEQLLILARLEPAEQLPDPTPVALAPLVQAQQEGLSHLAEAKQVRLRLSCVDGQVTGNAEMLSVLLRNLLDNAIRYTPEGGEVRLGCMELDGGMVVLVEDSGPGIEPAQRERMLKRFTRGSQDQPGCGLGLSIVERIAQLHHARLLFDDSALGGLQVRVIFPPAAA